MSPLLSVIITLTIGLLLGAFALCVIRGLRGPSLVDRILSADLVSTISAAILFLDGIRGEDRRLLDPAVVIVLVSFIATIAFARIVEIHWND